MNQGDRFLVADVGATKVQLFYAQYQGEKGNVLKTKKYFCDGFDSLEEIILDFMEGEKVQYFAAGVPGPVSEGRCRPTNLNWVIDSKSIKSRCKIDHVLIVNDLELLGHGVNLLDDVDLVVLQKGKQDKTKAKALLSVGTGLGEGIVFGNDVIATEGGHEDYAAFSNEEIDFLKFMRNKLSHVSFERVLSGEGIETVYEFFGGKRKKAAEIFSSEEDLAQQTKNFFLNTLGKEAGNLSLKTLCKGGLYLSGGVLQKNALLLQQGTFLEAFAEKGRFKELLKTIPVFLIKNEKAIFYGGRKLLKEL